MTWVGEGEGRAEELKMTPIPPNPKLNSSWGDGRQEEVLGLGLGMCVFGRAGRGEEGGVSAVVG